MKKRIFTAINLPDEIKDRLVEYQSKWPELPIRWTKKENLHITLDFLGYLSEKEILSVLEKTKKLVFKHNPFIINLNRIIYAPPGTSFTKKPPRMIWAVGKKVHPVRNKSPEATADPQADRISNGAKEFNLIPHITLGRIKTLEWRRIEPEERPIVDEEINLNFEVKSIEVMESKLTKQGAEYTILKSYPLN